MNVNVNDLVKLRKNDMYFNGVHSKPYILWSMADSEWRVDSSSDGLVHLSNKDFNPIIVSQNSIIEVIEPEFNCGNTVINPETGLEVMISNEFGDSIDYVSFAGMVVNGSSHFPNGTYSKSWDKDRFKILTQRENS